MRRILLVSKKESKGGAAIAARRLFMGLINAEQESIMLVQEAQSGNTGIVPLSLAEKSMERRERLERMGNDLIRSRRKNPGAAAFSFPYPGIDLTSLPGIGSADIVNVHHVPGFLSVESIARLNLRKNPVVLTLHDQWMFTGGCHYSGECAGYIRHCLDCPQLHAESRDIPGRVLKNKLRLWNRDLTVVTPSRWMRDCAQSSRVFRNNRVEWIPNGLDTGIFSPKFRNRAKQESGIPSKTRVILFGAPSFRVRRKGFAEFLQALDHCMKNPDFASGVQNGRIRMAAFGQSGSQTQTRNLPIQWLGKVNHETDLVRLYCSADLFILPSLEDNLPNTMLEAMACGTPVIAFDTGGIPDAVHHGETGMLARCGDSAELGAHTLHLLNSPRLLQKMGRAGVDLIRREYNRDLQADRYIRLFSQLCGKKSETVMDGAAAFPASSAADLAPIDKTFLESLADRFGEFGITADSHPPGEYRDRP